MRRTLSAGARLVGASLAPATLRRNFAGAGGNLATLRALACREPCSSTAEAIVVATPLISRMVALICRRSPRRNRR